jgi:hypothetical protein
VARASKDIGVLFDQPVPHHLVMLLVLHTLAIWAKRHNHWNRIFGLWPVNVGADDKSVIHRDGNVAFDHHCIGWIKQCHLDPLGYD